MMRRLMPLALIASLCGCATTPAISPAQIAGAVERAQARFDQAKAIAALFLPYLPADHAARIELAGRLTQRALDAARTAASIAEQRAALKEAEVQMKKIDTAMDAGS